MLLEGENHLTHKAKYATYAGFELLYLIFNFCIGGI